jgi:hypothetical protein
MAIESLSAKDQTIILRCMQAVGVLIEEWEMHSRLGVCREELDAQIAQWPAIDDRDNQSNAFLAVNNSLNEICHGISLDEWTNLIDATLDEVRETYREWLRIQNARGGIR